MSIDRSKLEHACYQLNIDPFDAEEYDFLQQYYQVTNKVAVALKVLEGNRHGFGLYLPTLIGLRTVLDTHSNPRTVAETEPCLQLAIALKNGFERRFADLMDVFNTDGKSAPLYIAMITNPQYKLNFMGTRTIDPRVLHKLKEMLVDAAIEIETTNPSESKSLSCTGIISSVTVGQKKHGNSKFQ